MNYFKGRNPEGWHTGVSTFSSLIYRELYPGIDLIYEGADGLLKGTFRVEPGANPQQISWHYTGADAVGIDPTSGDLQIRLGDGSQLLERAPVAWQMVNGRHVPVAVRFVMNEQAVSIAVSDYDPTLELILDPVLEYSTYLGGSKPDDAWGIAADNEGFAYVVGHTESLDFPDTEEAFDRSMSIRDAFVVKINTKVSGASSLVWATYLGGSGGDSGWDVAVDHDGNVYLTGTTGSDDFPITSAFQTLKGQGQCCAVDAFLSKLDATGSQLLYSTYIGGRSGEEGYGVAVDSNGNAYVTGNTFSADFTTTSNAFSTTNTPGQNQIFVTKVSTTASGSASLIYSSYIGVGATAYGGIAADDGGNVYLSGRVQSSLFPTTANAYQSNLNGTDAYIARLDTTRSGSEALIYSTFYGGSGAEDFNFATGDIATDGDGFVYVTGETTSPDLPVVNAYQPTFGGVSDAFVARFDTNAAGNASLLYATYLGGSGFDQGYGIAATRNGNVYITGQAQSRNFPLRDPITLLSQTGAVGSYVTKMDTTLAGDDSLIYSTFLGRNGNGFGGSAVDSNGTAYVAGQIAQSGFPIVGGFQPLYAGQTDGYMAKLSFRSDLEITKVVEPEVTVVDVPVTVTISVTGKGPETATGVILTEFLPSDTFELISADPTQGDCTYETDVIRCDLGHIEKQQVVTIIIIVRPLITTDEALASLSLSQQNVIPSQILASSSPSDGVTLLSMVDGVEEDTDPDNNIAESSINIYTFDTFVPALLAPSDHASTSDTTPTFQWQPIPGAVQYELQYSQGDLESAPVIVSASSSFTPATPLLTTTYRWRVRGVAADDRRTAWSTAVVTIAAANNAAPERNLLTSGVATLTWGRVTWASRYEIEVDNNANFRSPEFEDDTLDPNVLSISLPPLPEGKFYWRVRAGHENGTWGSWSTVDSFVVRLP